MTRVDRFLQNASVTTKSHGTLRAFGITGAEELGTPPKLSLRPDKVFGDEGT